MIGARQDRPYQDARPVTEAGWMADRLGDLLMMATILFLLIGASPYDHQGTINPDTGVAVLSPVNRYAWFALTGLALPLLWGRRDEALALLGRSWPYLLLVGWFSVTTIWALDPDTSRRRLILLICQSIICMAACLQLRNPGSMHRAIAASCAIVVMIDLASWIFLPGLSQTDVGLAAIHNHKNSLGLAMMFSIFSCSTYVFTQRTFLSKLFWISIIVAAAALLVASLSKTSAAITVSALAATPFILLLLRQRMVAIVGVLVMALTLVAVAAQVWFSLSYLQSSDPLWPIRGLTFTQRTDVWQFVIQQITLRPWGGAGFGSFWDIDPTVQPSLHGDYWFAQADIPANEAHNGYLDLFVTTGIIGLVASILVIFRWIGRGFLLLHNALRSNSGIVREQLPYLVFLTLFPVLICLHNTMESSYFNTVGLFSFIVVLNGLDVDLRNPSKAPAPAPKLSMTRLPVSAR